MSLLRRISAALARTEEVAGALLVWAIVAVILAQVLFRRFFGIAFIWSEEFCTYAFIAVTMLGAAAATHRRAHIRLTLVADRLGLGRGWERWSGWLLAAIFLALLPGTVRFVVAVARLGLRSPALDLPMPWIYGLVPLALLLFAVHLLAGREERE